MQFVNPGIANREIDGFVANTIKEVFEFAESNSLFEDLSSGGVTLR